MSGTATLGPLRPTISWPEKTLPPTAGPQGPDDQGEPRIALTTLGTQRSRVSRLASWLLCGLAFGDTLQPPIRSENRFRATRAQPSTVSAVMVEKVSEKRGTNATTRVEGGW
jgi:hypothetical protein